MFNLSASTLPSAIRAMIACSTASADFGEPT